MKHISTINLAVLDYDEAIAWFRDKLGFTVLWDQALDQDHRFVRIAPEADSHFSIVLAKVAESERAFVGNQAPGVLLFLNTDAFWQDYQLMRERGVVFLETPREEVYATVAVFQDLYGNRWDLIQPKPM